jgi:hypothetical protein
VTVDSLAKIGGVFAILTLCHFVADWVFQSHDEAMAKSRNALVRARHCSLYTIICGLAIGALFPLTKTLWLILPVLWISHFLEDSYVPIYMWARYIRRPPEITAQLPHVVGIELAKFVRFADTTLGKILIIALDQIVHLVFLIPIATVLVLPSELLPMACVSVVGLCVLLILNLVGKAMLRR